MARTLDLVIVTVSYNTREVLGDCLQSVLAALARSGLRAESWVVDNASADGSAQMVRERFVGESVHLLAHNENVGFAAGNNLALRTMGLGTTTLARHILFLNPDTRIVGDALSVMVRFLDSTPQAGVAGARLVHGDGSFQHSAFAFPGLAQIELDFFPIHHRLLDSRLNGRYPRRLYEGDRPFQVDHPLGAALMVRAETLNQVGSFDESFFMYCEEVDLCRRIKDAGWQIYCVPQAEVVHLVGQSAQQFRDQMFVALWRSRFLMYKKHNSPAFQWAARQIVRLGLAVKSRQARAACRRGRISPEEMAGRLGAYQEVVRL